MEAYIPILQQLRQNARFTLTKMSKNTGIPVSTIFDRMKDFEEVYIDKHTSLINFKKLGYDLKVNFIIKVAKHQKEDLRRYLEQCGFINNLMKVNSGYDFLFEGIFRNMDELDFFEGKLEDFDIAEMQRHFILEDIKRESFMV